MAEKIAARYCGKAGGHVDIEGVCGSHWIAEIVVRPVEGVSLSEARLDEIAREVEGYLEGDYLG